MDSAIIGPRRLRRGLSIIEILVALSIVLAVAAIAVPWTAGWLGGRELDHAEDQLSMQLMMARAAAREEGRPVEVVAAVDGDGSRVEARFLDGEGDGPDGIESEMEAFLQGEGESADRGSTVVEPTIRASWARLDLPSGVRLVVGSDGWSRSVRSGADDFDRLDPAPAAGSLAEASVGASDPVGTAATTTTLAIFLPDGTAIVAPVFMLRTDSGRTRAMQVDRTTGRPRAVEDGADPGFESSLSDDADAADDLTDRFAD